MCWHNWKEYKDKESKEHYRICRKCGIAQVGYKCASLTELLNETHHLEYKTDETLCRTNNWIDRENWKIRYGN